MNDLAARAESFLFSEGGALSRKKLASLLAVKDADLFGVLETLAQRLHGSGVTLVQTDSEVALAVAPEQSAAVAAAYERELSGAIGDAGLEVLAIVLYRGPSTRAQIDYIRGVNTVSTIRTLLSRGLLERVSNPDDAREYLYRPTVELLAHLGVRDVGHLPQYENIKTELAAFETRRNAESSEHP